MTALLLLVAVAALATPAAPATAGPGPAGTLSLAANSTVRQLDEALVWWQTRALDTADMLPRSVFEDVLQRHHQQQQQTQATVENRRTIAGTMAMAAEMGYTAENHTVRTSDGYLLTLFRLPNPGKPTVFIAHGLLGSSADFLVQGRGGLSGGAVRTAGRCCSAAATRRGLRRVALQRAGDHAVEEAREHGAPPWHSRFWDFSWHDIGYSDIPASIDVVLKTTGQSQVHFVGFCQGSTSFFVLGSERSDYLDKIKTFVGLAPVAFVRDVRSFPVRLFSLAPSKVLFLMKLFGVNEFLPNNKLISLLGDMLCTDGEVFPPVCSSVLFLMFGTDTELMNTTILPTFFANSPAGASTKQLLHYGQLVNHKHQTFRQFDYGRIGNLKKYGQPKPPDYNLTRLNVPSYLFYSDNDNICVQSNIDELSRRLPNIPEGGIRKVMNSKFNHLDYILARNAKELVYDSVIEILRKNDAMSNTQSSAGTTSTNPATAPTPLTSTPSTTTPTTTPVTTAPTPVVSSTSNPVSSYTSNTIPSIPASSTTSSPVSPSTVNPISISTASPATTSADNYANPNNPIISASTGNPIPSWSSFTTSTASPTTSARSESPPSPAWPAWPIGSGSSSSSPATPPGTAPRSVSRDGAQQPATDA